VPYRTAWEPPPPPPARPAARDWDELIIPLLLLGIGSIRAVPALLRHHDFGAGDTVALAMVVLGALGVLLDLAGRLRRR
jgi:hypothetical protein